MSVIFDLNNKGIQQKEYETHSSSCTCLNEDLGQQYIREQQSRFISDNNFNDKIRITDNCGDPTNEPNM